MKSITLSLLGDTPFIGPELRLGVYPLIQRLLFLCFHYFVLIVWFDLKNKFVEFVLNKINHANNL
jgi:hypothetical protein